MDTALEQCPGCGVRLPKSEGPTHRYIGASAGCWALYTALLNGGAPPLAPTPANALLIDAYAAHHPGVPSPQAVQSVAVHLLTLYGVLVRGVAHGNALWVRQRALRVQKSPKHSRFSWLTPPSFVRSPTVLDIVQAATPTVRTEQVEQYVAAVWSCWSQPYADVIATWYEQFVVPD